MDPVVIGVSIALEAHRRGMLADDRLQAVLGYYDDEGSRAPASPADVLTRIGRINEARVLELIELTPLPTGHRKFTDRLTTHELIGRGGMGAVYKGYDRLLKRVVALKVVDVSQVVPERRRTLLGRFEREARVMARLRHPAIAQLYDAGSNEAGNPYLAMELVPGRNLDTLIEECAPDGLDIRRVLRWGATLADALHACHQVGVIHRDVKPSNVIVTPEDDVRLIDFGIAVDELAVTRLTAENARVGTALYMAPEQARGEPCDARSDVYALGGTIFHALAGRPPLDAPNVILLLDALRNSPAPRLRTLRPTVPADVDDLLHRCLQKAPDERPTDAAAVAVGLRQALAAKPRPVQDRPDRRRLFLSALLVFTIAIAGVAWNGSRRPTRHDALASVQRADAGGGAPIDPAAPGRGVMIDPTSTRDVLPAGIEPGGRAGEYVNTKDGSVLVFVPEGQFRMGQPETGMASNALTVEVRNDRPAHIVRLSGYFIGKHEVTWAQYRRFAVERPAFAPRPNAHIIPNIEGREFRAMDDHPVFGITWEQARAYCEWAGVRLPTEAEWEYAARGGREGQIYPWGDDFAPDHANVFGDGDGHAPPAPVGACPRDRSPFGCLDMVGNVSEWVWDIFGRYTQGEVTDPQGPEVFTELWDGIVGWRPAPAVKRPLRVIRGGAWTTWDGRAPTVGALGSGVHYYQVTRRYAGHMDEGNHVIGFRVCRSRSRP